MRDPVTDRPTQPSPPRGAAPLLRVETITQVIQLSGVLGDVMLSAVEGLGPLVKVVRSELEPEGEQHLFGAVGVQHDLERITAHEAVRVQGGAHGGELNIQAGGGRGIAADCLAQCHHHEVSFDVHDDVDQLMDGVEAAVFMQPELLKDHPHGAVRQKGGEHGAEPVPGWVLAVPPALPGLSRVRSGRLLSGHPAILPSGSIGDSGLPGCSARWSMPGTSASRATASVSRSMREFVQARGCN